MKATRLILITLAIAGCNMSERPTIRTRRSIFQEA